MTAGGDSGGSSLISGGGGGGGGSDGGGGNDGADGSGAGRTGRCGWRRKRAQLATEATVGSLGGSGGDERLPQWRGRRRRRHHPIGTGNRQRRRQAAQAPSAQVLTQAAAEAPAVRTAEMAGKAAGSGTQAASGTACVGCGGAQGEDVDANFCRCHGSNGVSVPGWRRGWRQREQGQVLTATTVVARQPPDPLAMRWNVGPEVPGQAGSGGNGGAGIGAGSSGGTGEPGAESCRRPAGCHRRIWSCRSTTCSPSRWAPAAPVGRPAERRAEVFGGGNATAATGSERLALAALEAWSILPLDRVRTCRHDAEPARHRLLSFSLGSQRRHPARPTTAPPSRSAPARTVIKLGSPGRHATSTWPRDGLLTSGNGAASARRCDGPVDVDST